MRVDGPIDTTGAGDSATAGAVLALASGATLAEAALVGNLVASITIQQLATTGTARPRQLPARLEMWQKTAEVTTYSRASVDWRHRRQHMSEKRTQFALEYLKDVAALAGRLDAGAIGKAVAWLKEAGASGATIYSCGNGGSASIASQMAVDMVKGASTASGTNYRMVALTDSIATITACANDICYESVFVEPLKVFARPGDVLIAISGSGGSLNVLAAAEYANANGLRTIGITTNTGGRLKDVAQLPIVVPTKHMGRLEDIFFVVTHIMCYACMDKAL